MSDTATVKKQLKINTGSVKRLWKECALYTKEEEQLRAKLVKLKEGGAEEEDGWYIKNTMRMIEESVKTTKVTQNDLSKGLTQLADLVKDARANPDDFKESEELNKAEAALAEFASTLHDKDDTAIIHDSVELIIENC